MKQKHLLTKILTLLLLLGSGVGKAWADEQTIFSYDFTSDANTAQDITAIGGTVTIGTSGKYEAGKGMKLDGDSGTKYVKLKLDSELKAGDVITIAEYSSSSPNGSDYGISVGLENFSAKTTLYIPAGKKESTEYVSVTLSSDFEGKNTLYLFRHTGKSTYISGVTITRFSSFSVPIKKWSGAEEDSYEIDEDLTPYMEDHVGTGETIGRYGVVVGMTNGSCYPDIYAKYDDCKTLHVEGDAGVTVRLVYNYNSDADFKDVELVINSAGFADFDIAGLIASQGLSFFHVNSIKLKNGSTAGKISKIEEKGYYTTYYDNYTDGKCYTVTYGATILPTPDERTGYLFAGWADASTGVIIGNAGDSYIPTANRNLNAQWELNATKYELKYELFGHGSTSGLPTESSQIPTVSPVDDYYNFEAWYFDQPLKEVATPGDVLSGKKTLYAKWTKKNPIKIITDATVLTFTDLPSNTLNFDWYGSIQGENGGRVNATAAGAATKALKFDTKGSLTFDIAEDMTLDLYFEDNANNKKNGEDKTIKIDDDPHPIGENAHNSFPLAAGRHTILRGNDQFFLYVLKLTPSQSTKPSDLAITPSSADVEINTNTSPFTITTSSDGLLSIKSVSNNKISAFIDDNGKLIISAGTATVQGATITIEQEASGRYEAGEVSVRVNVVKPTLPLPAISCTDNAVTITSAVEGATIYYTTDGSDPKNSNTKQVYSGVFLISAECTECTIKAYATANNYNDSETSSQSVTYTKIDQYTYAVNAVDENGNTIKTFATGVVKDVAVSVYYPIIFKEGDIYYKKNDASKTTFVENFGSATDESEADIRTITYVADASIVGFAEGESSTNAGSDDTYSNGKIGRVAAQNVSCRGIDMPKLPAGIYAFVTSINDNAYRGVGLRDVTGLNNSTPANVICANSNNGVQTQNFTLTKETSLRVNGPGNTGVKSNQSANFDYAYITHVNGVVFTTQPVGDNYGLNSTHELTAAAVAYYNGDVTPSYQWYKNSENSTTGATPIDGATNATYTVPTATEGIVYYYCVASYTDGQNTIDATSNIVETIVCKHPVSDIEIGNADNTSVFNTEFSKFYSLADGESREFTFKNFSDGTTNYNNWSLYGADSKHHYTDDGIAANENYHLYVGLRADNYDNVVGWNGSVYTGGNDGIRTECTPNPLNWDTFRSDMHKGTSVTVKVARKDDKLFFYARSIADQGDNPSNNTYVTTYTKDVVGAAEPMYLYFTVERAHLTDFSASDVKPIFKVSAAIDGENGTAVTIYNAEGMVVPQDTYFSLGDEVRIVATPAGDYLPNVWTSTGTQGTIDLVNKAYDIKRIDKDTHVTVSFAQNTLSFTEPAPSVILPNGGTTTYTQLVTGAGENIPTYSVIGTTDGLKASIVQEVGSSEYTLHVTGTGTVTVAASLGGLYATYTLTVTGVTFADAYQIYDFSKTTHEQPIKDNTITGETYSIIESYGDIKEYVTIEGGEEKTITIAPSDGTIRGFDKLPANKGGAIVVKASKIEDGEEKYATYTLTVPYDKYVWNFYKEGAGYSNTNPVSTIVTGNLVNGTNPGSAILVSDKDANGKLIDISSIPLQPEKDRVSLETDLRKRQNWKNEQGKQAVKDDANDPHNYWNYTYKTMRYLTDNKTVTYTNEGLFSYKNAVHGDNARIVTNTAGLVFECDANKFGLNDNRTTVEPDIKNGEVLYTARQVREMDRAVLLQGYSSFTIPHVKDGYYVKLYWYRHADNAGDQFRVENAKDLDDKIINPNDVLRFTGSAYFRNPAISDYRGCTFLKPQFDGANIKITIANPNWTELYRIEVTDKFETDLKICEEEIAGYRNGNEAWAGTDMWNSLDINDPVNYNTQTHSHVASRLTSKIATKAAGHQLISYAPEIHFSGYPGHCFTWNAWNNTTLQATLQGAAQCASETNAENNVTDALPIDPIWVGSNIRYTAHHLKNVHGAGNIKLTLRTHSGAAGEPHYTLDKTEATVAVGEYSVQDYPYTWDFTQYNLGDINDYGGKTFEVMNDAGINATDSYGNWGKSDVRIMTAYNAETKKALFAQGAQLNLGDGRNGQPRTILESEGLCIDIPSVDANNNNAVTWSEGESGAITVNGTITIPEVPEGMYVFVRSASEPSVEGATDMNGGTTIASTTVTYGEVDKEGVTVSLNKGDIPSDVWVYKQVNESNTDVVITPNGAVLGIGVTDIMKPMVKFKDMAQTHYSTDARDERIDYKNTGFFTNHKITAYVADGTPNRKSDDPNSSKSESGTIELREIGVVPSSSASSEKRGLLLEDAPEGSDCTPRPLLPLFVPASNKADGSLAGNQLVGCIDATPVPASDSNNLIYILTNQYYDWDWANKKKAENSKQHIAGDASFYINRVADTSRKNSAYLSIPALKAQNVKQLYIILGEDDAEESTAIDAIEISSTDEQVSAPVEDVYTLTGVKLNGMPTQKGVYVVNGKKVLVK